MRTIEEIREILMRQAEVNPELKRQLMLARLEAQETEIAMLTRVNDEMGVA